MRKYTLSLGQSIDYKHPHPERTAVKSGTGVFSDNIYQIWPNRKSMAKSIRMQQRSPHHPSHWRALVPLTDGEGY